MMKILTIIPARGGSKGIPRKNIKLLGDKPLIAYTIEIAKEIEALHTVMVSTEDKEISGIVANLGMPVPFMRPETLAQDTSPTIDVVINVVETYKSMGVMFDAVMILEPTCPFRRISEVEECIDIFKSKGVDSLITVKSVPAQYNPHWVYEENGKGLLVKAIGDEDVIARRQNLPKAFARDGSVYITKTDVILNQHSLYGESIAFRVNDNPYHINLDSPADWEIAERILREMESMTIIV